VTDARDFQSLKKGHTGVGYRSGKRSIAIIVRSGCLANFRVPTGSQRFTDVLAFRDYLRAHPDTARQYEQLKHQLAARYSHDRNAYTDGKSAMVAAITERARSWSAESR
jgi:hypothetical protein